MAAKLSVALLHSQSHFEFEPGIILVISLFKFDFSLFIVIMSPKKKQPKSARLLKQLVAPTDFIDEEDGSTSQQPSPMARDKGTSSAVVGASLLLLSDHDASNVGPRTEALLGPPQSQDSTLPASQPASQQATHQAQRQGKREDDDPLLGHRPCAREEPAVHD